jgi:hypothetical protein
MKVVGLYNSFQEIFGNAHLEQFLNALFFNGIKSLFNDWDELLVLRQKLPDERLKAMILTLMASASEDVEQLVFVMVFCPHNEGAAGTVRRKIRTQFNGMVDALRKGVEEYFDTEETKKLKYGKQTLQAWVLNTFLKGPKGQEEVQKDVHSEE